MIGGLSAPNLSTDVSIRWPSHTLPHFQPPGMVLKPCKYCEKNYQPPQLVSLPDFWTINSIKNCFQEISHQGSDPLSIDPEKNTRVSKSWILTYWTGSVGIRSHSIFFGIQKWWNPKDPVIPPKKILYPPNCTLSAFLAATWIHRESSNSRIQICWTNLGRMRKLTLHHQLFTCHFVVPTIHASTFTRWADIPVVNGFMGPNKRRKIHMALGDISPLFILGWTHHGSDRN